MQIWCNRAQERYVLAILEKDLETFRRICARERCPFAVVGTATDDGHLQVRDDLYGNNRWICRSMCSWASRRKPPAATANKCRLAMFKRRSRLRESAYRVMRLPTVAKNFLITIGDRSVGGLTHRDQMVGKYQTPVADAAITP